MTCKVNGKTIDPTATPLRRVRLNAQCINGDSDNISIDYTVLWELQMEQMTAHWEAVPTTSEDIILQKKSVENTRYDTVLIRVDPAAQGLTDLACLCPYRWTVGDHIIITFPNSEDQNVGVEFMGKEV
jgi:hypothetical protein